MTGQSAAKNKIKIAAQFLENIAGSANAGLTDDNDPQRIFRCGGFFQSSQDMDCDVFQIIIIQFSSGKRFKESQIIRDSFGNLRNFCPSDH